ncbi:MAG: DUF3883 domain-containing protein, partial [Candidatus Bathyarchaeota archaeon]|nr:DUF3883 domain-containing protein [Candidatus Bathyarchaeota archaeon]
MGEPLRSLSGERILPLKCGDKVQCVAVGSDSPIQTKLGIQCIGKLGDGRVVLFDKKTGLSKSIKPGDRVEGSVIVSKSNYIIVVPEKIIEQSDYNEPRALPKKENGIHHSKWDHSLIILIRREKEKQKSPDLDRALELISKELYGEKTHYVLELIQNAEDEEASGISFTILGDEVKVWNNGEAFTPEDVESICSVRGGKRNKIGFFGIGFKSVFNITDRPQVISGRYNFAIEKFIYPVPCDTGQPEDFDSKRGAWFFLPYDKNKHKPEDLEQSMRDINEKVLLFLRNLKEITFIDVVTGNRWYLERKEQEGNIVSLFNSSSNTTTLWKVFSKDLKVPETFRMAGELRQKPEVTRIAVAFPIPNEGTLQDVTSEPIYCYLPTKKRTDMPFLIQGDFDPTVGRENIKNNEWNNWLLLKIGELVIEAYQKLRDQGTPHELFFRYLPANDEVKDPVMRNVYETMKTHLKNCPIAPTEDGCWVTPTNVVVDTSDGKLKSLIADDIEELKGKGVGYLSSVVDQRGRLILLELGAKQITLDDLIDFLQRTDLIKERTKKGAQWFLQLYAYLSEEFYENKVPIDRVSYNMRVTKLRTAKIILTAKNELVAVNDPEKHNSVIFYPPKVNLDEEYRAFSRGEVEFVHHYLQNDTILRRKKGDPSLEILRDKAKEFLAFLGIRRYFDDYTIINDVICRLLESPDELSDESIVNYTKFVLENIGRYVTLARSKHQTSKNEQEILQTLGDKLTVKAFYLSENGKTNTFVKASEAYFTELYGESSMEKLFDGVKGIVFLSDIYVRNGDIKQWREFFQKIGTWASPRIVKIESKEVDRTDTAYAWVPFQAYYGRHTLEGDWVSPDIQALFEFTETLDKNSKAKRFELLWKILNDNWGKVYQKANNCIYTWTPISQPRQTKIKSTSFLNTLRTSPWVLASDGSLSEPDKLFTPTTDNRMLLGDSVRFLAIEGHQSFIRDLGVRENPTKQEVMHHLRHLKLEGVSYTTTTLEKFKTLYSFLMELSENPTETEVQELEDIKNECKSEELIYIPRKDKEWWSTSKVFWKDYNQIFGKLRGYLSSFYNSEAFPTFKKIGIKESIDLEDCVSALKEISETREITEATQAIINSIYLESNRMLVSTQYSEETIAVLRQLPLLTRPKSGKYEFVCSSDLVLADDEHLANIFSEDLKILWLGCSYSEVSGFIKALQIKPLSSMVEVNVKPIDVTDAPPGVPETVREWTHYLEPWIRYKRPKLYATIIEGLEKLKKIDVFQAEEIHLTYKLQGSSTTKSSICDAYYDRQENKLYVSVALDAYSPKIASEICRIFAEGEALKEPILALLSAGEDDKKRIEVFEQFGIPKEGLPSLIIEKVEPKLAEETKEEITKQPLTTSESIEKQEEAKPETHAVDFPEKIIQIGPVLINPDEYIPSEIAELAILHSPQGSDDVRPSVVRAVKGTPPKTRKRTIALRISPQLPEDVAFELVKKFEESEKRSVDDAPRDQKNVGYDLSSSDGTSKRFVDIKSSKYDNIIITMTKSEWRKAELEGDNYYLYIVTGLRTDGTPKLRIIQNPYKWLKPDIPSRINFTNWDHAVRYEVSYT